MFNIRHFLLDDLFSEANEERRCSNLKCFSELRDSLFSFWMEDDFHQPAGKYLMDYF